MTRARKLTRRAFSSGMLAATALSRRSWANEGISSCASANGLAFVGTARAIHVFRVDQGAWHPVQLVEAAEPIHLELHPSLPIIYIIHRVDRWDHLPRGAVSTYSIRNGLLSIEGAQPLSLSATLPRHGAVSPDGHSLAVATEGGGIYNLFPIAADGSLQSPVGIVKEVGQTTGSVHRSARPRFVAWSPNEAMLFALDTGNHHINAFAFDNEQLHKADRFQIPEGFSLSHLVVSPNGKHIYVLDSQNGCLASLGFDHESKIFAKESQLVSRLDGGPMCVANNRGEGLLMTVGAGATASKLTAWKMNKVHGGLRKLDEVRVTQGQCILHIAPHGNHVVGVATASGLITQWCFDKTKGRFSPGIQVAQIDGAISLHSAVG